MSNGDVLRVLTYHRILDGAAARRCNPSLISATPHAFESQMRYVAAHYRAVSLREVLAAVRRHQRLPRGAVLITFDDACRDVGEIAWPILRRYRLPATIFTPTAFPGDPGRSFWWDRLHRAFTQAHPPVLEGTPCGPLDLRTPAARRRSLRAAQRMLKRLPHADAMRLVDQICRELDDDRPFPAEVLTWDELRALVADGADVAAHTRTHPALTTLDEDEVRAEIRGSFDDLRRELGEALPALAYPFGDHDDRVVGIARDEGFELAFTTRDGHNVLQSADPLRLRRTNITPRTTPLVFAVRLTQPGGWIDQWRHRPRALDEPRPQAAEGGSRGPRARARVAYIVSRFPKLSETFVLHEMRSVASLGLDVQLYPLLREHQPVMHPEAADWLRRAHLYPLLSPTVVLAQIALLVRRPGDYLSLLLEVLRETWGSRRFFIGALGTFPLAVRFAREMQREGITHIHAHFANNPALAAFVLHRLTGIPYSFTAHGSDLHVERRMLRTKVAAAEFVVTVSEFNKRVIADECGEAARDKVHVLHCGVDLRRFAPSAANARPRDPFRLACVASFEEVKGHRFLVEAIRLLRQRGLAVRCDLVGEGPMRGEVEARIARHGLGDRIHVHGGLPGHEVAGLLRSVSAAVLASHPTENGKREGIPVALMEAMASGLPVVATAISGIPELVEAEVSGLLVPSGDPGALADAIERLVRDPELCDRLGRAAREKVEREFNLRTSALMLERLFTRRRGLRPSARVEGLRETSARPGMAGRPAAAFLDELR